jgi:ATP-dependent DNA ligase
MNKTYDTIYSKDSLGNIRIWYMKQQDAKYCTISGLKDGEKVTSEWTLVEGKNTGKKNATSAEQQATAEIISRYKKQLKTGYFKNIKDAGKILYVEPMLAQSLHKLADKNLPDYNKQHWAIQCKFNGNRCVATKSGLFTRTGERYMSVPHIEAALKPFFDKNPDAVLDGELFNNDLRQKLNEISELLRKTVKITPEILAKSKNMVRYYVYDGYGFNSDTYDFDAATPYRIRKEYIDGNIVGAYDYIEHVETTTIKNESHMMEIFQKYLADQQEGGILRNMAAPYEHKRSKNLVKVKVDEDDEAVIVDLTDGNGNWSGAATNVTLKWKDKTFDGVFKGEYEQRVEILKNKKDWIGKTVTFFFMGLTGLGTPNFARVNPDNCFKTDR